MMKAKPYKRCDSGLIECVPGEADHILLHLDGPFPNRMIPVIQRGSRDAHKGPIWTWNGSTDKPTLKPSILTQGGRDGLVKCHTWITDGQAIFLSDSTHEFAGQTRDLLEVE